MEVRSIQKEANKEDENPSSWYVKTGSVVFKFGKTRIEQHKVKASRHSQP